MSNPERIYIERYRQLVEEKFHFNYEGGSLRQRDLEYLAGWIEEKTGIVLSLSTLKRLWKKDYDQTPHPSTLQALVAVLGYKDWQEFKLQNPVTGISLPVAQKQKRLLVFNRWLLMATVPVFAAFVWLFAAVTEKSKKKLSVNGPVRFAANKTMVQDVPTTVIFNYDLGQVEADSFFFQQSWNGNEKVSIDPGNHYYSNIYYYPGFHIAKLIANDSVIRFLNVHITTNGWLALVRRSPADSIPVYIKKSNPLNTGILHITPDDLHSSNIDMSRSFMVSYFNVHDFENTYSDNFSLETRIICDSSNMVPCPAFELTIICEGHIFYLDLATKGCERNIGIKMGEVRRDGASSDLSMFGRDLYKWQRLQIRVVQKKATIYLDGQPFYTISFKDNFGRIEGLNFNFTGTGAVDYVKLTNGQGRLVYQDDFDK